MDNNVQTFIEKTLNIDELLKNSSDVTALYKIGIIYLFGSKVGFITQHFCNKKLFPDVEISNLDCILLDPSKIKIIPEDVQINTFKQVYLVKYVPGGTMLNIKTNIEQPTINYNHPVIIIKAFSKKQTARISVEGNTVSCKFSEGIEASDNAISLPNVQLPDSLRDAVCKELQKRMINTHFLYAPSFPEVLRSAGIQTYKEYAYSVEQFVNLYLSPNYKFCKNIEIGGKRHPGVILLLDGKEVDDVITKIEEDSKKVQTKSKPTLAIINENILVKIKNEISRRLTIQRFVVASMLPEIAKSSGMENFRIYANSVEEFVNLFLPDYNLLKNMMIDGTLYPGVIVKRGEEGTFSPKKIEPINTEDIASVSDADLEVLDGLFEKKDYFSLLTSEILQRVSFCNLPCSYMEQVLTCAARILYGDDGREVLLNEFQKELIVTPLSITFIKKWKKDGRFPEFIINECAEASIATFDLPDDTGYVVTLINKIGYSNSHNDNYAGLIERFSVCSGSLTPLFYFVRFCIQSNKVVVGLNEYCQLVKDVHNVSFYERVKDGYKLYSFEELLLAINRYIIKLQDLPRNLRTHVFSVYFDTGNFGGLENLLGVIDSEGISVERKLLNICNDSEECAAKDIEWLLSQNVNLQLIQKTYSIIWEKYFNQETLPIHFLEMLNWIALYHNYTSINEVLRFHITNNKFTKYEKQLQLMSSFDRVCRIAEGKPEMYLLASYIANIATDRNEDIAIDIRGRWPAISNSLFENILLQDKNIITRDKTTIMRYFRILSLDIEKYLIAQNKYADLLSNSHMLSACTIDEARILLNELLEKEAYEAYSRVFWDMYHRLNMLDGDILYIEQYVVALIGLRKFAEAIAFVNSENQFTLERRNELLIRVMTENFRINGLYQKAFSIFNTAFTINDAIVLLQESIFPTKYNIFTCLIALYCNEKRYEKALYLYHIYHSKAENGFADLYSQLRSKTSVVYGKLKNRYDVIELAFNSLNREDLMEFLTWVKLIPVPEFKGETARHPLAIFFDKLVADLGDSSIWLDFIVHMSRNIDINSWMVVVCDSVLRHEFKISYSTAEVYTAIRNVIVSFEIKDQPYNLLPYIFAYIEDYMDIALGQNIIVRLSEEELTKKLIHNNYWYDSYQKEYDHFKNYCLEQFSKTGNEIYNDFLKNLGLELDMSDLIHLAESSAEKSFIFHQICHNYMMGLYPSETVAVLNAFDVNKLSQRDAGVLSLLKILYKDDDALLLSELSILENEDRIRRFKYDCAKIISVFPQKKELYSFEDANSDKCYKLILYAFIFEVLYSEDIYDKYVFEFSELYANRHLFEAYLFFLKHAYNAQLIWNTGYWFFYKKWRYLKWTLAECLSDGRNYSETAIIEAMKNNGHYDMVYENDYKPFRKKIFEFYDIDNISDKVKKFFLYALMTGNYKEFLSQNALVLSTLSEVNKALFRDIALQLDFRKFNLELYRKYDSDLSYRKYDEALSVASAISFFAFDAINALKNAENHKKAYSLFSVVSQTEKESAVVATVFSLDDKAYSENAEMLLPLICSRQFDFNIYSNIRRSLLRNAKKISEVRYQLLGNYLEKYYPVQANAVRWHLAALKAALQKDQKTLSNIVREHDISTGIPVQWENETNNIIEYANGKTERFSRDYSAQDGSQTKQKKEISFSFVQRLAVVFGVKEESISFQDAQELYQRFKDKLLPMWDRIQSGLSLILNYPSDNKAREQSSHNIPKKKVLSFQVGMALVESTVDISLDDRLLVLTEIYDAKKLIQGDGQEDISAQLIGTYSNVIKRGLSLSNWITYAESINQFLLDTHSILDFNELKSRIINPAASLFEEIVSIEERYEKLKGLLGASKGLESPYAESVFDAIRRECRAIENGPRLRINIENEMVTDGQLYFVIENIGTRAVDIQREGLEIVLHQTGHPKRGNIEVANIGRLQRGSLTGGHVALILDTEDTQIEASISICKRDGDKIIVFSSVTRKLCIGQCTNEFSLKSTTRYDVDNAVRGSEILFGRDDIKEELSAIIPKGIAVIYGPSRIGKTSLMNWIQDSYAYDKGNVISISFGAERDNGKYTDYQKNFIDSSKPVPYDDDIAMSEYLLVKTIEAGLGKLSKYTKPSKKQFTKDTRSQIIRILQDESMGILEKYNELNVFLGDEDLELWLMLDEFQQVVERWNIEKTCDFARVCQMISYDRGSNIKLIICGSDDLLRHMVLKYDSVWQDTFSPSCRVVVGPLNPDSFKEMIQAEKTLCGSNIVYSEDAQRALYSYAGGVALYGKEICNTILAEIYAKPTLYSGRHHIYVSDIATKTQELLHTQASSLAAKDSVRIVEIYKAVTKNLDSNSDMQYLWYIAKWINTNPDKEGFAENDFSKEGMLKNPNQMHDSLEIAVERGILRMHVSSKDGQTYYNFRTIFYYYAILERANKYDKDLIYVNADEDTDVNASKSKVQEIIDSFYTLSDPDDQKKVVGAIYTGLDEDVQEKFRRGVGSRHEGDVIINGDKIGEQHNVHVNVQSITNILNGILAAGTDTSKILSDLQKLPRLSSYFAEAELPKLLENMESEDQEIAYEAEAKIDEKTSQMVSEYRAGLAMSNDISESFSIWNILGISKQEYDWLSKKLDPSFVSDLYFAAKLDSIFAKLDSNKVDSQVKDYSPVSIMYCKVLEKMLKFYHTDVYCERVPRVSTEVKIDGTKVMFGELEDEKTRMLVQNKILLGAFRYPINPEFVDRDPRNLVRLSCGDPDIRTVWKNHGIMLNKVIAIRNDSAHGADGVYIDRNRLNELKKMLFLNEGLLTIVELSK